MYLAHYRSFENALYKLTLYLLTYLLTTVFTLIYCATLDRFAVLPLPMVINVNTGGLSSVWQFCFLNWPQWSLYLI